MEDKSLCYLLYHIAISLADYSLAICNVKGKQIPQICSFFLILTHLPIPFQLNFPSREDWKVKTYLKLYRYNWGFFYGQHILNQAIIFHKFSSFSLYVFRIFYIRAAPNIKERSSLTSLLIFFTVKLFLGIQWRVRSLVSEYTPTGCRCILESDRLSHLYRRSHS